MVQARRHFRYEIFSLHRGTELMDNRPVMSRRSMIGPRSIATDNHQDADLVILARILSR